MSESGTSDGGSKSSGGGSVGSNASDGKALNDLHK